MKRRLRMTLRELAKELQRISDFRYLTCRKSEYSIYLEIILHWDEPFWQSGFWYINNGIDECAGELSILSSLLDLSEYRDANGDIDYSKCIVEVEANV